MKITLLCDDAIRLEATPGALTIEAAVGGHALLALPHAGERARDLHLLGAVLVGHAREALVDDLSLEVQLDVRRRPASRVRHRRDLRLAVAPAGSARRGQRASRSCARSTRRSRIRPRIDILAASELPAHEHAPRRRRASDRGLTPVVRFTVAGREDGAAAASAAPTRSCSTATARCARGSRRCCARGTRATQLEVVSSQQPGVIARFPWIPARAYAEALQLVAADGTTWQGAAAIEQLLDVLPRGRLISWVFQHPLRPHPRRPLLPVVRAQPLPARLRRALPVAPARRDLGRGRTRGCAIRRVTGDRRAESTRVPERPLASRDTG